MKNVRLQKGAGFDAIFARVWVANGAPPKDTSLWWCRAELPARTFSEWGSAIQIMTAQDRKFLSGTLNCKGEIGR